MTITSFYFFILVLALFILYYTIFFKMQWFCLLLGSIVFYYFSTDFYTIILILLVTSIAFISSIIIFNDKPNNFEHKKIVLIFTILSITIISLIWFLFKWKPLEYFVGIKLLAALGMGYYTLQAIGYILDCYWGNLVPQKNFLKVFLFLIFFPQLTTGPISRYNDLSVLYQKHSFNYDNLCHGAQRILYGVIKKLVIAERLSVIVNDLLNGYQNYKGIYTIILVLIYPLLMYTDFSGCTDIVLGTSELFDIHLHENFNAPFFSRNVQEFWQRWHITLGSWAKDYIMYPILKSKFIIYIGLKCKTCFNKKTSKIITMSIALFFLWFFMGFWHGGIRYILGVSLWYWSIMVIGLIFSSTNVKFTNFFVSKKESFSWHLFQSLRTYTIYAIGAIFFLAGIHNGCNILLKCLRIIFHPSIMFLGESYLKETLFVSQKIQYSIIVDYIVIFFGLFLVLIVDILKEKYVFARFWVDKQCIWFRWLLWFGLIACVVIFAKYGPGYNAADFIYKGF